MTKYRAGDIVFVRGDSWLSRAIRRLTQDRGEAATVASHVGILIRGSDVLGGALIVEALMKVMRHRVNEKYKPGKGKLAVFRPVTLTDNELDSVLETANSYVGRKYGVLKIFLHFGDFCLGGCYFFRKMGVLDSHPICSYLVAKCFSAVGKDFGVPDKAASPDDIWDFCLASRHYSLVRPLASL